MTGPAASDAAGARRATTLRRALIAAGVVGAVAITWLMVRMLDSPPAAKKPTAQQIQLVRPTTPPPPPPKPPEKPPEPPKLKEEAKLDTPKPQEAPKPAEAPPAARLGVDAAGSGQGDGFGLAANPGGRDLTSSAPTVGGTGDGGGGGVARAQYAFYRDVITRHINEQLNRVGELRTADGQIAVLVWIDRSGRIERIELRDATPEQGELIRKSLLSSGPMREAPPAAMPQPVWVLVNLRELG